MFGSLSRLAAHRPPLRILFQAARAANHAPRLKHLSVLLATNTVLASFSCYLYEHLYTKTRGMVDDALALRLPLELDVPTWQKMVDDYVSYAEKHDKDGLKKLLEEYFDLAPEVFDEMDAVDGELTLQADPNEQHRAGYYGFMSALPAWQRLLQKLEGSQIGADLIYDLDESGKPMILVGLYSEDSAAIATHAYREARERGLLTEPQHIHS